jgi:predicted PhzF superfamily epimerase YddE/YHI9
MHLWLIDAFTDQAFAGNPAGVCLLDGAKPDAWLQSVARELNQAETAFLLPQSDGYSLRWFTPTVEMDLCGHATLASAHFLWTSKKLKPKTAATFQTRSGTLTAVREGDWIQLDFPATPPAPCEPPPYLLAAFKSLGAPVFRSQFDYLVVLDKASQVRDAAVDMRLLREIETRGVIITAPGDQPGVDFVSRFFAPKVGVDEDPVTGSAHCALAPYWAERLGRSRLTGYQASARGGMIRVEHAGDRVRLGGQAVTVVKGKLEV